MKNKRVDYGITLFLCYPYLYAQNIPTMKNIYTFLALFFCLGIYSFASGTSQITIGGVVYQVDTLSHMKVGPGSYYSALKYSTSTKQLRAFVLEVDSKNPYIRFESVLGRDSTITTEKTSAMAIRKSKEGAIYFAGTNADFFDTSTANNGYPIHGCIVEGQIARTPSNTPHMVFSGNVPLLDAITFSGSTCTFGAQTLSINNVNVTRGSDQLILYNTLNGNYTHANSYGTEVLIELPDNINWNVNTKIKAKVVKIESHKGNMHILANHAVLSGHGTAETFLTQLKENDEVEVYLGLNLVNLGGVPQIRAMVGGDRMILQSGLVTDNDWAELHPRTAIGYSIDQNKVYFCVVDGRYSLSNGTTTKQLADIIKSAGAYNAINLDGGGSSAMYIKEFGVMNHPSDGNERAVCNGIYAVNTSPTDNNIAEIRCSMSSIALPRYGVFSPIFYGYNQYGTLINTNVNNVKLSCSPEMGEINSLGAFVASGSKGGTLQADYNGTKTSIKIVLSSDAIPSLRLDSILADKKHRYPVEVEALAGEIMMPLLPQALSWTVDNPEICSVNNGIVEGISNGTTYIQGKLGDVELTQKVIVEIPATDILSVDKVNDLSSWAVKGSSNILNPSLTSSTLPTSMKYTYSSGRSPYVQLYKEFPLYSIPDSMKIVLNSGKTGIMKAILTIRANNQSIYSPIEYTGVETGKDFVLSFPINKILTDVNDRACYPVRFEGLKLMLNSATQTANEVYEIQIKEFSLSYGNVNVGFTNPELMSRLRIYPNPVTEGIAYVAVSVDAPQAVRMELYSLSGEIVRSENLGICQTGEIRLPLQGISSGTYLLNLYAGTKRETMKIIIK